MKFEISKIAEKAVKRFKPALNKAQARAHVRQEQWMRKRQSEWFSLRRRLITASNETSNMLSDWFEIPGWIQKTDIEVRPNGRGWKVVESGITKNDLKTYPKKQQAVNVGKRLARHNHSDLKVYRRNNSVQQHITYN